MAGKPNWKNLVKDLKGYNDAKQKAEENPNGDFPTIPNGNYDARVVAAEVRLSKNKEAMAMISLIIIGDSEQAEQKIASFIMLEGNGAALDRFIRLGYELPETSSEIGDLIEDLGSSEKEVSITVKGGFATINGLLDEVYVGEEVSEEEAGEDVEETTEEEVVEETEEDETVDIGDDVNFEFKGEKMQGTIISTDEKTETAKIKSGKTTYTVKLEKILGKVEEEASEEESEEEETEEEVEEEPKVKPVVKKKGAPVAKKTAAKPAAKKTSKKK